LDDCAADARRCRAEYPFEIRNRQRIEEILKELGSDAADVKQQVQAVDQRIRSLTHSSGFVWDERLQSAFPNQPYWYLYTTP
jgi:hypothetical protein